MAMPSLPSSAKFVAPAASTAATALPDAGPASEDISAGASGPFASLLQQKIGEASTLLKGDGDPVLLLQDTASTPATPSPEGLSPLFAMLSAPDAAAPALIESRPDMSDAPARGTLASLLADRSNPGKPGLSKDAPANVQSAKPELPLADSQPATPAKPASPFEAALQTAANLAVKPDTEKAHAAPQLALVDSPQVNAAAMAPTEKPVLANDTETPAVITTPVGHEGWSDEVGDRLVWMSKGQESKAEIILTPPHLGKIEVSLNISGDQASLTFVSANPQVRDALEDAMSRLREVLAENGIQLGQTNVGAESFGSQAQGRKNGDNGNSSIGRADAMGEVMQVNVAWGSQGNGMVDTFA